MDFPMDFPWLVPISTGSSRRLASRKELRRDPLRRDGKNQKSQDGGDLVGRRCFPSQSMIGKGTKVLSGQRIGKEKHHVTPRLNDRNATRNPTMCLSSKVLHLAG